ncbi:MAG TPA: TerB family tellurite resistance protein [Lamprocystis sp. (in: g-proteobacteria)]|nr:TerB family tellurite resistance protein [Lamprocystis sp. (in: g-proteobacteria)]
MTQPESTPNPELAPYPENSPEAMLRVITLFIVCDGDVAEGEMEIVDRLGVLQTLGADRNLFAQVFDGYCDDLIAHAGTARYVGLADTEWVDAVLAAITDPERRRYLASALLLIARSDGHFADSELTVYRQMLDRWGLNVDDLAASAQG